MKKILVFDLKDSYYLEFFKREFTLDRIDLRIAESTEEAKFQYSSNHFSYIFIGDVIDIEWMTKDKMVDKNIHSIVLYSQNPELVANQKRQISTAFVMPFYSLTTFIDLEQIKVIVKE
jgi:hypothetical protein